MSEARLPTYKTAAEVLERDKGSGLRLAGWTVLRTILIAPPMMVVGVDTKRAFMGAALASGLISVFTLMRLFDARNTNLVGVPAKFKRHLARPHLRALGSRPTRRR